MIMALPGLFSYLFFFHMKFEENGRGVSEKVIQSCGRKTVDGRRVITIAHPEPSAQVS